MKSVITGGAGFIGSRLTETLLENGDQVVVIDNLSTGSVSNLSAVLDNPRLHFIEGSVLDRQLVESTISTADRVYHLAAAVGVKVIVEHPLDSLRTNIRGTENVLEATHAAGATLLMISTSEVYGKNTSDGLSEDAEMILGSPLTARWSYAAAKYIDEAFAHAYWHEYRLGVVCVRLFNTVGPRQTGRYGMVVPNLVGQAQRDEPLTVFGDGQQTRCFSYVGDVVPALVKLSESPAAYGRSVNIGGGEEISILGLAHRVISVLGSRSTIRLVPYEEAYADGYEDMRRRVPNNSLAKSLVGYEPTTPLDEVIRRVAEAEAFGSHSNVAMTLAAAS